MGVAISRHNTPDYQTLGTSNITSSRLVTHTFSTTPYTSFQSGFISAIVGAAFLSALSVIMLVILNISSPPSRLGDHTHIPVLFGSLIMSNLLQAIGTTLNTQWVFQGGVSSGTLCSVQGGIKHAGNVGTAVWSFALALHAFCLLFLRSRLSKHSKWFAFGFGWTFISFIVMIGPLAIQKKALGPYFGPSGFWCWITVQYPAEQTFLEYMLEWISAFFSFVLYAAVLLRVRGNLVQDSDGRWFLRWVRRSESWQLAFTRDYLDSCTVKMAAIIVSRDIYRAHRSNLNCAFVSYTGVRVPQGFTFTADLLFALGGFANLLLFVGTRQSIPDLSTIPEFSTPRSRVDKDSPQAVGITPFVLVTGNAEDQPDRTTTTTTTMTTSHPDENASASWSEEAKLEVLDHRASVGSSIMSFASHESIQPLRS
ncbi:hypothetical protein B0F90DRAFT_1815372 [Multifurca ochricompacta]|uniref:Glucose receptor Git3 N-terminal domain-containing protein n=1 Tax=Multifurca ochricompacta TaxID=376703 RepID=A0AAD4M7N8_9AGAM|nr:hypothetical protein B0F90DRAFT_1815372 [Multifurca ochricompacta]